MQTQEPTPEMIEKWKTLWQQYRSKLAPNRKTGKELLVYLSSKYPLTELCNKDALDVVSANVLNNDPFKSKLLNGPRPSPKAFFVDNVGSATHLYEAPREATGRIFVGIDLNSGYYCVEGSDLLWDELCAFQGLDESDLDNYYSVAQYVLCLQRFDLPIE